MVERYKTELPFLQPFQKEVKDFFLNKTNSQLLQILQICKTVEKQDAQTC